MTHRSRTGGPQRQRPGARGSKSTSKKLHHPPPPTRSAASSSTYRSHVDDTSTQLESVSALPPADPRRLSVPTDAAMLQVVRAALRGTLDSPTFADDVQKVKRLLYERRWLEVFGGQAGGPQSGVATEQLDDGQEHASDSKDSNEDDRSDSEEGKEDPSESEEGTKDASEPEEGRKEGNDRGTWSREGSQQVETRRNPMLEVYAGRWVPGRALCFRNLMGSSGELQTFWSGAREAYTGEASGLQGARRSKPDGSGHPDLDGDEDEAAGSDSGPGPEDEEEDDAVRVVEDDHGAARGTGAAAETASGRPGRSRHDQHGHSLVHDVGTLKIPDGSPPPSLGPFTRPSPTNAPTLSPTNVPTLSPTNAPTPSHTNSPTPPPTNAPPPPARRIISLGGGAASELLATAALIYSSISASPSSTTRWSWTAVDIGAWGGVVDTFRDAIHTAWDLEDRLGVRFVQLDMLSLEAHARLAHVLAGGGDGDDTASDSTGHLHSTETKATPTETKATPTEPSQTPPTLITLFFTLAELLAQSRTSAIALLRLLTAHAPRGTVLLVVDTASDISELAVGSQGRRWPNWMILDTILLGTGKSRVGAAGTSLVGAAGTSPVGAAGTGRGADAGDAGGWITVDGEDARWFRLGDGVGAGWPVKLENTRYWFRCYRRV